MPFTFAHPAAVAPIYEKAKGHVDLTALILGSMAPDFEYFIRFKPLGLIGHGVLGMLYFNLPLCILFAYVFHRVVKMPLILHMPRPLDSFILRNYKSVYDSWSLKSIRGFMVFAYSALIGMITHVVWDGFTHDGAYFVSRIDALSQKISILGREIPVYKLLQHGSTFLGFILICIWIYKSGRMEYVGIEKSTECTKRKEKRRSIAHTGKKKHIELSIPLTEKIAYFFIIFMTCIVVVCMVVCFLNIDFITGNIGTMIISLINGSIIGIVIASMTYNSKKKQKKMDDI